MSLVSGVGSVGTNSFSLASINGIASALSGLGGTSTGDTRRGAIASMQGSALAIYQDFKNHAQALVGKNHAQPSIRTSVGLRGASSDASNILDQTHVGVMSALRTHGT